MSKRHPRAHESDARRAQLDRLKDARQISRRRKGIARGPYGARDRQAEPLTITRGQLVAELQRIAMGGVMPAPVVFALARPANWPTAEECCVQFETTWNAFAQEANLQAARGARV